MSLVRPRYPASQRDYDRIATAIRQVNEGRLTSTLALTAAPTSGSWAVGDVVRNSAPVEVTSNEGPSYVLFGWICTASDPLAFKEMRVGTGAETVGWDDLRFPAQSINPIGTIDAPTQDQTETGFPGTLLFSGSRDDMIGGIAQMPHRWKRASLIRPHIHWSKTTGSANAVVWNLYLRVIGNPGDVAGAWSTAYTATIVAGDQTVTNNHILSTFGDVTMANLEESAVLAWRLYRRGSTDAEANTARLYELDFHIQSDKFYGTETEIPA